jgi:hypothetical protein
VSWIGRPVRTPPHLPGFEAVVELLTHRTIALQMPMTYLHRRLKKLEAVVPHTEKSIDCWQLSLAAVDIHQFAHRPLNILKQDQLPLALASAFFVHHSDIILSSSTQLYAG